LGLFPDFATWWSVPRVSTFFVALNKYDNLTR